MYGSASSEVVLLKDATANTFGTGTRDKPIGMQGRLASFLLKLFREVPEDGFQVEMKADDTQVFFDDSVVLFRTS